MDRKILLNYSYLDDNNCVKNEYEWLEDENELSKLLVEHKKYLKEFKVIDCIEILNCREIDVENL